MSEPNYTDDRRAAADWARAALADESAVILDSETTGLRSGAEVCQIAVIDVRGEVLLDTLVRPERGIPADATAIHGITDEQVADAPPFTDVYLELHALLQGKRVIVYNTDFDMRLIRQSLTAHEVSPFGETEVLLDAGAWECAMRQYAAYCGDWNDYFGSYRFQKLPNAAHTALSDCRATLRVLERMAGVANTPITVLVPEEHAESWRWGGEGQRLGPTVAAFITDLVDEMGLSGSRDALAHAWWSLYAETLLPNPARPPRTTHPVVRWEPIPESKEATDVP